MTNHQATLDSTFRALADPTRRAILARLALGPATVSELGEPFAMAMPSLLQHLKKLEGAGLLTSKKHGRVRTCTAEVGPIREASTWLSEHQAHWERRLDALETFLDDNP